MAFKNIRLNKMSISLCLLLLYCQMAFAEPIWIDVRSEAEYQEDNIKGDINIPHEKILKEITKKFPDKNTEIRLYCRSGRRSGIALDALQEAGYQKVSNAGGISDARKERGLE